MKILTFVFAAGTYGESYNALANKAGPLLGAAMT
jgi:hypothetical protein